MFQFLKIDISFKFVLLRSILNFRLVNSGDVYSCCSTEVVNTKILSYICILTTERSPRLKIREFQSLTYLNDRYASRIHR